MRDGDYILGTDDEEIARLGIQHRVWQPMAKAAWRRAGIGPGSRVIDVGAGPGYATRDLAACVGPDGRVLAVERSAHFAHAVRAQQMNTVEVVEADLMAEPIAVSGYDAAWCRWVASFVTSPETLILRIASALKPGGVAVFHEYAAYATWRLLPARSTFDEFVRQVIASWRAAGGEPDIAIELPSKLQSAGFRVRETRPLVYAVGPRDPVWQWPASFVASNTRRLKELGRADDSWAGAVLDELAAAQRDPSSLMITPLVLEIIAERGGA